MAPIPTPALAPVLKLLLFSGVIVAVGATSVVPTEETLEDSLVDSVEVVAALVLEVEVAMIVPIAVDRVAVSGVNVKADVISDSDFKADIPRAAGAFDSDCNEVGFSLPHSCLAECLQSIWSTGIFALSCLHSDRFCLQMKVGGIVLM